jgi:hypothetical protein
MRRVIKLLTVVLTVILIPVVIAAGFYGFVYWKVTEAADDFALQISPYAQMSYEKVFIDPLETEIGLDAIKFTPVGSSGDIQVESLRMRAPSWGYFFDFQEKVDQGNLPESFDLRLKGLLVDLNSGYMRDWANMAADVQPGSTQSFDALACGERDYFSLTDLKKMRYSALSSDVSLLYFFSKTDQMMSFDVDVTTGMMMEMSMAFEVGVATDELNMQTMMFAQPQLKSVELRYKDRGYNKRRINFCTAETNVTEEQYRENYRQALYQNLQWQGWIIPEGIFQAFDQMNNPGGSTYIRLDMPQGFGAQTLMTIQKPSDLLTVLNPYVEFNGKPVLLDGISWEAPDPEAIKRAMRAAGNGSELAAPESSLGEEDLPESSAQEGVSDEEQEKNINLADLKEKRQVYQRTPEVSFKEVAITSLRQHVGKQVQLRTYFGRKIEGELVAVSANEIKVEHRLPDGRGTAVYPISKDKIESAKLYH